MCVIPDLTSFKPNIFDESVVVNKDSGNLRRHTVVGRFTIVCLVSISIDIMSKITKVFDTLRGVFTGTHHQSEDGSGKNTNHEQLDTTNIAKVLIIGETGSGKSTFINYLTNYFRNGSLQNIKIAIPSKFRPQVTESFGHCELDIQNTTQSKTDACHQYMFSKDAKNYIFLDTPGLSDTRGAEQDNINISKIIDSVEGLSGLTAVIIVVNGAVARLTVNLLNVIIRLRGNLPDVVMDNVVVVLTNSTRYAANFSVKALELNGNVYPYYMQNSAFSTDPSTWNNDALGALQYDWDQAMEELKAMVQALDTFKTKSVTAFKNMKDIRNEIKTLMHSAQLEVTQIQKMQDEIASFDAVLAQASSDLITYKDYSKARTVENIELVDSPHHSTLCQNCNHVCHDKCGLQETTIVGAQIFQGCWAMSEGNCTKCPNNCSYTAHYHAKKTVQKISKTLNDVLTEIKAKYDKASDDQASYQQKITSTADAKELLEKALVQKKDDIINLCEKLQSICSGFNLAQELHALINQLEMQASMLRNIDAKQQATAFIRSLKEFCEILEKGRATETTLPKMNIIDTSRTVSGQANISQPRLTSTSAGSSRSRASSITGALPPNPSSHANEDVLATIRAINTKKSMTKVTKNKTKVTKREVESTGTEANSASDDTEDEKLIKEDSSESQSDESDEKKARKKKSKNAKAKTVEVMADQFKELTINELLSRHRGCKDQRLANFIVYELAQRSHGKSTGPLKNSASLAAFTSSMQRYSNRNSVELRNDYDRLKEQVVAITEPDILKIGQVPNSLLSEIAAVYSLLQRTPSIMTPPPSYFSSQSDNHYLEPECHPSFGAPVPHYNSTQYSHKAIAIRPPLDTSSRTAGVTGEHRYSSRLNIASMHTEQLPQVPRRSDSDRYRFSDKSAYDYSSGYATNPQERYSPDVPPSAFRPINDHGAMQSRSGSVPPPARSPHDIRLSADGEVNRPNLSPSKDQRCSPKEMPRVFNKSGYSSPNDTSDPAGNLLTSGTVADYSSLVRNMTDTQLLSAHMDSFTQHKHAQCNIIYNELRRRCSGDHPILIRNNQALFEQKCNEFQDLSQDKLRVAQTKTLSQIQEHLNGDDATHLKEVSKELIIEAAALAHCIGFKSI